LTVLTIDQVRIVSRIAPSVASEAGPLACPPPCANLAVEMPENMALRRQILGFP
jgi:hypothetical protein